MCKNWHAKLNFVNLIGPKRVPLNRWFYPGFSTGPICSFERMYVNILKKLYYIFQLRRIRWTHWWNLRGSILQQGQEALLLGVQRSRQLVLLLSFPETKATNPTANAGPVLRRGRCATRSDLDVWISKCTVTLFQWLKYRWR